MATASVRGLDIAYDELGSGPPILLVMGIGAQRVLWPDPLVERLAEAGHRVIRFDNRDVGESTWLRDEPVPPVLSNMLRAVAKQPVDAPYTLSDMAGDAAGLLDALGIERAHVVGASLGGMIAQQLAIEHPTRLSTLTSIMSGPGSVRHMIGRPSAIRALLKGPPKSRAEAQDNSVALFRVIGGELPLDVDGIRERAGKQWDVGLNPAGFARQWSAMLKSGSRLDALRSVRAPTLVVHGTHDPLVPPRAGKATAGAIPGAKLVWVQGMGHAFSPASWPFIVDALLGHIRAANTA